MFVLGVQLEEPGIEGFGGGDGEYFAVFGEDAGAEECVFFGLSLSFEIDEGLAFEGELGDVRAVHFIKYY